MSDLVGIPNYWFSHAMAQMILSNNGKRRRMVNFAQYDLQRAVESEHDPKNINKAKWVYPLKTMYINK